MNMLETQPSPKPIRCEYGDNRFMQCADDAAKIVVGNDGKKYRLCDKHAKEALERGLAKTAQEIGKSRMNTLKTQSGGSLEPVGSAITRCPFCGSSRVYVRFYNQPSVVCEDCLCMGPAAQRLTQHNKDQCEQEAVLRWNKRVDYSHKITLETPNVPAQRPPAKDV